MLPACAFHSQSTEALVQMRTTSKTKKGEQKEEEKKRKGGGMRNSFELQISILES